MTGGTADAMVLHRTATKIPNGRSTVRNVRSREIFLAKIVCFRYIAFTLLCLGIGSAVAGPANIELQPPPTPADQISRDLFNYETTYTFNSDFKESKLG